MNKNSKNLNKIRRFWSFWRSSSFRLQWVFFGFCYKLQMMVVQLCNYGVHRLHRVVFVFHVVFTADGLCNVHSISRNWFCLDCRSCSWRRNLKLYSKKKTFLYFTSCSAASVECFHSTVADVAFEAGGKFPISLKLCNCIFF